ncbi:diaminopimelate decarboxylase [Cryptosporangium arvum]|uniref:Diaminopimelate decarboxylase n=1 Tax=Cryptosporangium arvum DSM 44712 TaxID=927661 RepID=A0A010Z127_9ACTN|nr:diaminopimelate decarboxylase [Cryptosporangium arvum]EXG81138.1 diaminopimelate decarboxylase [Cryptosporangium arvum DSM 44712]
MTLPELLPSLRTSLSTRFAPEIWPLTTRPGRHGDLLVGGVSLRAVAEQFGTPTYVLDEADVRTRCRRYTRAFGTGDTEVAYASKALLCGTVARWIAEEGLALDVCSAGELAVARAVGFPPERVVLHGNAKTAEDLRSALDYRVGRVVIDSVSEVARLAALATTPQRVLLRVIPGVDAGTHSALTTGVEEQKFGLSLTTGAAADAARRVLGQHALALTGVHCHIGSQVSRFGGYERALSQLVTFLAWIRDERAARGLPEQGPAELDLGGGHAVPYRHGDDDFAIEGFAHRIHQVLTLECERHRLPLPRLTVEPGRAIVARAGVTLYRVITIKRTAAGQRLVAVDGGMGDNLRTSLYGARYTVSRVGQISSAPTTAATVVGRYCEPGDVIARDVPLPDDVRPGELLAVPGTGAYHHSLANNYNMVGRPPLVVVRDGEAHVAIRRETIDDLLLRDAGCRPETGR